jgi:hypothetical protein
MTQLKLDFAQAAQIQRVRGSTAWAISEFFTGLQTGQEFHADDLRRYVAERVTVAPASPDRVMRDMRKRGEIDYTVVSRSDSRYRKLDRIGVGRAV